MIGSCLFAGGAISYALGDSVMLFDVTPQFHSGHGAIHIDLHVIETRQEVDVVFRLESGNFAIRIEVQ